MADTPLRPDDTEWTDARVNAKVRELEFVWRDRKEDDKRRVAQYRGTDGTEAPDPEDRKALIVDPKIIKGRRAMEIINFYTGVLAVNSTRTIDSHGVGGDPQAAAENASDWLNAIGPAMEFQSGENTTARVVREALTIGFSAKKTLPYPQAYADWPELQNGQKDAAYTKQVKKYEAEVGRIPIRAYHVPAMTWFPLLYGRQVLLSIEKKRVPVSWVKARARSLSAGWIADPTAGWTAKDTEEVDFIEVLDPTWVGYYVKSAADGPMTAVKFWKHGVKVADGQCPVSIYECNDTSDTELKWRWQSLIESIRDPLELEDFVLSQQATLIRATYQPTMILELLQNWSADGYAEAARDRKFKHGQTNIEFKGADGTAGEKYRLFELPGNLPATNLLHDYVNRRIQSFLPPSMTGGSTPGDSGFKEQFSSENAERKLNPIADNFARADADGDRHEFACVGAIAKTQGRPDARVYVYKGAGKGTQSIGVTWPEVEPYMTQIETRREYVLETDYLTMADIATKMLSDPIRAPRSWVGPNVLRWDNIGEMDTQREGEDLQQDPAFRQKDIQNTLIQMGVKAVTDFGMTLADLSAILANGGILPPGMYLPKTLTGVPTGPFSAPAGAPSPEPPASPTATPGPGVTGADQPQLESPAASSPIEPPMPAPDVRTAAPAPPTQSGRGGNARRQVARPAPKRTKGIGK